MKKIFIMPILFLAFPLVGVASGAHLAVLPARVRGAVGVAKSLNLTLLNPENLSINAVEADLHFDPSSVRIVSTKTVSSALTVWAVEPKIDALAGVVHFAGGTPKPITGDHSIMIQLSALPLAVGTANFSVSGVRILLADGKGTDVAGASEFATWTIERVVASKESLAKPKLSAVTTATSTVSTKSVPGEINLESRLEFLSWLLITVIILLLYLVLSDLFNRIRGDSRYNKN